jgi:hypothetical protein
VAGACLTEDSGPSITQELHSEGERSSALPFSFGSGRRSEPSYEALVPRNATTPALLIDASKLRQTPLVAEKAGKSPGASSPSAPPRRDIRNPGNENARDQLQLGGGIPHTEELTLITRLCRTARRPLELLK